MTFVVLLTKAQFELKLYIAALARDLQDVEDILQETNADIWRKAGSYDPSRPFLPWAKTLAKFQVLRWRKDRERDRLVLDDSSLDLLPADELEGVDLDLQMWALRRSLRRLPGDAFALIREKYAERRSIPDLARTTPQGSRWPRRGSPPTPARISCEPNRRYAQRSGPPCRAPCKGRSRPASASSPRPVRRTGQRTGKARARGRPPRRQAAEGPPRPSSPPKSSHCENAASESRSHNGSGLRWQRWSRTRPRQPPNGIHTGSSIREKSAGLWKDIPREKQISPRPSGHFFASVHGKSNIRLRLAKLHNSAKPTKRQFENNAKKVVFGLWTEGFSLISRCFFPKMRSREKDGGHLGRRKPPVGSKSSNCTYNA